MAAPPSFFRSALRDATRAARARLAAAAMRNRYFYRAAVAADVLRGTLPVEHLRRRSYKGASQSHLLRNWKTGGAGANTAIGAAAGTLRARSRDLLRNNAHAASAISRLTTRLVGCGIRPRSKTGDETLDRKVNAYWESWGKQVSVGDDLGIYGLQELAVRSMLESGEVLMRRRVRRPADQSTGRTLKVPLQLELLEADHLDSGKTETTAAGKVVQGVEFDAIGRRVAYWLYPSHPGEQLGTLADAWTTVRVQADAVAHLYKPLRPGQVRGIPWLAPVIVALRDLDEAQDFELVRMKMSSALVALVSLDEAAEAPHVGAEELDETTGASVVDTNDNPIERLEPGMVALIRGNKDVKLSTPTAIGGFPDYVKSQLKRIAAGIGVPYPSLASDLEGVNYSSYRAGNVEFRAMLEALQENLIVPLLCEPMWRWFIDAAVAAGLIPDREYPVEWAPPRYEDVDRVKEATADVLEITAGTGSRSCTVARKGYDPDELLAEIEADEAAATKRGLRFTTSVGSTPAAPTDDAADDGTDRGLAVRLIAHAAAQAKEEGDTEGAEALALAAQVLARAA